MSDMEPITNPTNDQVSDASPDLVGTDTAGGVTTEAAEESEEGAPLFEVSDLPKRDLRTLLAELEGTGRTPESLLEALLFSTHVPLSKEEIGDALRMEADAVDHSLNRLQVVLAERPTPLGIFTRSKGPQKKNAGRLGYIMDVRASYRRSIPIGRPTLGQSATETLALIALNQPIAQSRLVRERGSSVYEHVKEFLQKGWVVRVKRGRSYELRTTDAFAAEFGLENDPDLIKSALAQVAGAERQPEVVGSHRVHIDADPNRIASLLEEAQANVPPVCDAVRPPGSPPEATPEGSPQATSPLPATELPGLPPVDLDEFPIDRTVEDCLVEVEPRTETGVNARVGAADRAVSSVPSAPATAQDPSAIAGPPPAPKTPAPQADCLVPVDAITETKEPTVSENAPKEQETETQDVSLDSGAHRRVNKLFSMFDDESTDDDW